MDWKTYRDPNGRFEIAYPAEDVTVDRSFSSAPDSNLLSAIAFMDRNLANSETAALQLPALEVEVMNNPQALTLNAWLDRYEPQSERSPYPIAGQSGFRVSRPNLLAPNTRYYLIHQNLIYRLTILGLDDEPILKSFKLLK